MEISRTDRGHRLISCPGPMQQPRVGPPAYPDLSVPAPPDITHRHIPRKSCFRMWRCLWCLLHDDSDNKT